MGMVRTIHTYGYVCDENPSDDGGRNVLTRQQWIDAAYASVRDQPDATVTVNGVAHTLGTTKGSFYHHFNSRIELVLEVLTRHERDTEAIVDRASEMADPRARMRAFILDAITDTSYMNVEGFLMDEEVTDTDVEKLGMRAGQTVNQWMHGTLAECGATPDAAERLIPLLRTSYVGVVLTRRFHERTWLQDDLRDLAETLWNSVEGAIDPHA